MADTAISKRRVVRKKLPEVAIDGDVAYVPLTKGLQAIIDSDDVGLVSGIIWHALVGKHGHTYAIGYRSKKGVMMHRILLDAPPHLKVDHEDGNGLNNRRKNIRLATHSQNLTNTKANSRNKLGVKGVQREKGKYLAYITIDKKKIRLGRHVTIEAASAAYLAAARAAWGEFAKS